MSWICKNPFLIIFQIGWERTPQFLGILIWKLPLGARLPCGALYFLFFSGQPVIDVPKPVNICFKRIKQYLYWKMQFGVVFEEKFFGIIYFDISKIIRIVSFSARVITLSQCPITLLYCRLNSRIPRSHWSLFQSYGAFWERHNRDNFRFTTKGVKLHFLV